MRVVIYSFCSDITAEMILRLPFARQNKRTLHLSVPRTLSLANSASTRVACDTVLKRLTSFPFLSKVLPRRKESEGSRGFHLKQQYEITQVHHTDNH